MPSAAAVSGRHPMLKLKEGALLTPMLTFFLFFFFLAPPFLEGRDHAYSLLPAWIFSFFVICVALFRNQVTVNSTILLYTLFALLCLASVSWSIDPVLSFNWSRRAIGIAIVLPGVWIYCSSMDKIYSFLIIYIIAGLFAVAMGFLFNWSAADRQFLGVISSSVSVKYGFASIYSFLLWLLYKKKIYLLLIPILISPIAAVGGIRGFVFVFLVIWLFVVFQIIHTIIKIKLISFGKIMIIAFSFLFVLILFVQHGPLQLTARIGRNIILSQNDLRTIELGQSGGTRIILMKAGLSYLSDNMTLLGKGIGSSYTIYEQFFRRRAYSHTTPIELLMGLGLIGFILFYFIFADLAFKIIRCKKYDKQIKHGLLAVLSGVFFLSVFGRIFTELDQMMMLILIASIHCRAKSSFQY